MQNKFILVFLFAFLANPVISQTHWETIVYAENEWSYFVGTVAPDSLWKSPYFDDSIWEKGKGGLGYGDGDDSTIVENTTVLYSRINFEVPDSSQILSTLIHADYDDGIIVYLNGHEIARSGVEGINPDHTVLATANHEAQMYKGGKPEMFIIDQEMISQNLSSGTNTLAVQVHNVTTNSTDLSSIVYFSVELDTTQSYFQSTPDWFFKPEIYASKLPLIVINTTETINKAVKVNASMKIINHGDGQENIMTDEGTDYDGLIGIKIRGNQSSGYAQKPYNIETRDSIGENNNVSIFGLPKENDWSLINNLKDKTCINHALGYYLSREMNFWAANTRHCEVILNGEPKGIYVFMESLKVDDNRVAIAKLKPEEVAQPDLSGGYIFKVDYYSKDLSDCWQAWYHPSNGAKTVHYVYQTPEPEDIVDVQKDYIQEFVEDFEKVLYSEDYKDPQAGYRAYISVPSFINYLLINEVALNCDAYKKSCHFYKDKDRNDVRSLLNAGPVWDMDWAFRDYPNHNKPTQKREGLEYLKTIDASVSPTPNTWMARLMNDSQFANEARTTYEYYRSSALSQENIMHYIDSIIEEITPSLERHYNVWYNISEDAENIYIGEVDSLKNFITNRLVYLDENLPGEPIELSAFLASPITYLNSTTLLESHLESRFNLYPNPANYIVNIKAIDIAYVRIFSNKGILKIGREFTGEEGLQIDISHLPAGLYIVQLTNLSGYRSSQKLQIIR